MMQGFQIRFIAYFGPIKEPALLDFGPGLNVIYGASDTGKSFIVESIDFMLGGKSDLRDIPERADYDRLILGIESNDGKQFSLMRSAQGGDFRLFQGLHRTIPELEAGTLLSSHHNDKNDGNLSMFLLNLCGLAHKQIRKSKTEPRSLSFRDLARLVIVDEQEIITTNSPIEDGQFITKTVNFATFKLLLTGLDDSSIAVSRENQPEDFGNESQIQLLDELIDRQKKRLREVTSAPKEIDEQLSKLENALFRQGEILRGTESEYRSHLSKRKDLRSQVEDLTDRAAEISELLERFDLLDKYYLSDMERLRGLEEGGSLFEALATSPCSLCGADPKDHRLDDDCDGNTARIVQGARRETEKINILRKELSETVVPLHKEAKQLASKLPGVEEKLSNLSSTIESAFSPSLTSLRSDYSKLADKRAEVLNAISLREGLNDLEKRRESLSVETLKQAEESIKAVELPTSIGVEFGSLIEQMLQQWHFPGAERVFFDTQTRDLIIGSKRRGSTGKGLRAITHAAFKIGILQYCRTKEKSHPGFVVLDTPLRGYKEPEGIEDDLRGTDLNVQFYKYLSSLQSDRQVIVFENDDPPAEFQSNNQFKRFTGNPHRGRYGFFPQSLPRALPNAPAQKLLQ